MKRNRLAFVPAVALVFALFAPPAAQAHCDSLDGPVVRAAREALEIRDVNLALAWTQPAEEAEVRQAFHKALEARGAGPSQSGDLQFFETLVRLHRAGEGEPYTGLKPAGVPFAPAIVAADAALETGSLDPLQKLFGGSVPEDVRERYAKALSLKTGYRADADSGRRFVKAYVEFVHLVEHLHEHAHSGEGHLN